MFNGGEGTKERKGSVSFVFFVNSVLRSMFCSAKGEDQAKSNQIKSN